MPRADVGGMVAASFGFIGAAWRRAWAIMALTVIANAVLQGAGSLWPEPLSGLAITIGLAFLINAAATGALFRLRLQARHPGDPSFKARFGGLHWGRVETRVAIASVVLLVFFTLLFAVLIAICAAVFNYTGQRVDPTWSQDFASKYGVIEKAFAVIVLMFGPAGWATSLVFLTGVWLLYFIGARMMLYSVNAADTGSYWLHSGWARSRGVTGAIWLTWFIVAVVQFMALEMTSLIAAAALNVGADPTNPWPNAIGQAVSVALGLPMFAGLQLYVFERVAPPPSPA